MLGAERTWLVELRVVIYLEPIDAQASNLEQRLREDERIVSVSPWERTPGALGGADELNAMTTLCLVCARTREGARLIADRALAAAIEALIIEQPPGLLAPVLADVGPVGPASGAGTARRRPAGARVC